MANMTLEVILELVDRLTGPARDAVKGLEQFGAAARQAGSADAALRPDKWVEEGRAIMAAAEQAKAFETSAFNAAEAEKKVSGAPWLAMTEDIDKATAAVRGFTEQIDALAAKKLPRPGGGVGGAPGGKGEPSGWWGALENVFGMSALFEGPKAIETLVGGGAHLADEMVAQKIAGMTPQQMKEARDLAIDLEAQFPQFPLTGILEEARKARAVFNSDEEAHAALSDYLRMAALIDRDHPGEGMLAAYPYMRAVEEAGANNTPGKAHEMFEAFQRAQNVFGANITADDYQQVFQRGGAFARQWNIAFIRDKLPHLLTALRGDATGTMVATLGMAIEGGHVMGPALRAFDDLHLLDEKKVHRKSNGDIKSIDPGAIKGVDILRGDPVDWVNQVLWPAIEKATSDPAERDALLATALSNRNDLKAGYMAVHDEAAFERDKNLVEDPRNMGLAAADLLKTDPLAQWQALKSSIETLAGVASEPAMKPLAAGLDMLAGSISGLSRVAAQHPTESAFASGGAIAAIAYWLGKGLFGVGQTIGRLAGGGVASGGAGAADAAAAGAGDVAGDGLRGLLTRLATSPWLAPALMNIEDAAARDALVKRAHEMDAGKGLSEKPADVIADLKREPDAAKASRPGAGGAMGIDASEIEETSRKAKQAHQDLHALGAATVAPKVDSSALDALAAKVRAILADIGAINGGLSTASHRASFAGALHDGPEAR